MVEVLERASSPSTRSSLVFISIFHKNKIDKERKRRKERDR